VKFFGLVSYPDLFVLSSLWEGLPNAVLENIYLKKPIVATKCIPYMNKLIQNGENGFLVDLNSYKQFAEAILNYKKLSMKFQKSETLNDLNKIFLNKNHQH